MASETICFPAQVVKIATLADGGIRITFDMPETKILEAAKLMECKRVQAYGDVQFTPRALTDLDSNEKSRFQV